VHDARVLARLSSPAFLWAGVVAPPIFTVIYLVDGATRAGYDPMRHQVSLLSLGDRGWLQTLSFLVAGGLLVVFAIALRAWLGSGTGERAVPGGIAVAGAGLFLAGIFPTQPLFGYPPGTPEGMATTVEPAVAAGELELNVMEPVIARHLLGSMHDVGAVARIFGDRCIAGLSWNAATIAEHLDGSLQGAVEAMAEQGYAAVARARIVESGTVGEVIQ